MQTGSFHSSTPLLLESGEVLEQYSLAYTTYGQLNADHSNVVWAVHALTGDAQVADWWSGLVGENALYNYSSHFIICANLLGSGYFMIFQCLAPGIWRRVWNAYDSI